MLKKVCLTIFGLGFLSLPACSQGRLQAMVQPTATVLPSPKSLVVERFVWEADEQYGYLMLRPSNWEVFDSGRNRVYEPSDSTDLVLTVANVKTVWEASQSPNTIHLNWYRFQKDPSLGGWAQGMEQGWKNDGAEIALVGEYPQTRIYIVKSPLSPDELTLWALVVDEDQPLVITLTGRGQYTDLEQLRQDGIYNDFVTMVVSARALP